MEYMKPEYQGINWNWHCLEIENEFIVKTFSGIFRDNSFFIGHNAREAVNSGRADFVPIFLSEIPLLFNRKIIKLDVALINVIQATSVAY